MRKFSAMKIAALFFATLFFFSTCEKKTDTKEYAAMGTGRATAGEEIAKPETSSVNAEYALPQKTPQETIETYESGMGLRLQVEGNFTNSGNKEILAFYDVISHRIIEGVVHNTISRLYCFVLNNQGDAIEQAYLIKGYGTVDFDKYENLETAFFPELGREIFWLGMRFGYVGDFNDNGKEEFYLYEYSGMGFSPRFYEFDGTKFKEILDSSTPSFSLKIVAVDKENKKITLEGKGGVRDDYAVCVWDEEKQMYARIEEQ